MCILAVAFRALPDCPLLVLSNREEFLKRPSAPPRIVSDSNSGTAWLGGVDLQAGGTWLGVNQFKLVIAVSNRGKRNVPHAARSRGLLCRELLACPSVDAALEQAENQLSSYAFAGLNLLILSPQAGMLIEAADETKTIHLQPGFHAISNGSLNDPRDGRIQRAHSELQAMLERDISLPEQLSTAQRICGLRHRGELSDMCLREDDWGTVSSTVIALPGDPLPPAYLFAPGPPCDTPFEDYSHLMPQLLQRR